MLKFVLNIFLYNILSRLKKPTSWGYKRFSAAEDFLWWISLTNLTVIGVFSKRILCDYFMMKHSLWIFEGIFKALDKISSILAGELQQNCNFSLKIAAKTWQSPSVSILFDYKLHFEQKKTFFPFSMYQFGRTFNYYSLINFLLLQIK